MNSIKPYVFSSLFALTAIGAHGDVLVQCGGDFREFKSRFGVFAEQQALNPQAIDAVLSSAQKRDDVLKLDRAQHSFKQTFIEFSGRIVSNSRLQIGANKLKDYQKVFAKAQKQYGVPPSVIATFWAAETDFGAVQGNIHTVSALATLAHDCRRPELFQPQLLGAIELTARGGMDPANTVGAWAGEIGQVQMLPADILKYGQDGDGDGRVDLKNSAPDAILSAAKMISAHGWKAGQPWLQEVLWSNDQAWNYSGLDEQLTINDWEKLGVKPRNGQWPSGNLKASLIAPQGRFGPVFLAYDNYHVFLEWNKSFIYSLSAAYMATRFDGAPPYQVAQRDEGLSFEQITALQNRFHAKGVDVGKVDGIIGAKTRGAVRNAQKQMGMVSDGWPTGEFFRVYMK